MLRILNIIFPCLNPGSQQLVTQEHYPLPGLKMFLTLNTNIWYSSLDSSTRTRLSSYFGFQLSPSATSPDSRTLWDNKIQDHSLKIECASGVDCCFGLIRTCCFLNSCNLIWWIVLVTGSAGFEHVAHIRGNDFPFLLWKSSSGALKKESKCVWISLAVHRITNAVIDIYFSGGRTWFQCIQLHIQFNRF